MSLDVPLVLGSAVVGLLVGMTGAGGGALMTPMLIFLFGVSPSAAISSDLVAAVLMRPVGAAVHLRRGTVLLPLVRWLSVGSVPGAFLGAYLLHLLGSGRAVQRDVELLLGAALLVGAAAMLLRAVLRRRSGTRPGGSLAVRPLPTAAVGALGGVMVGMTSVGAGSLMIVLLVCVYPSLASAQLVGTDLVQAIPLTAAAALGQLAFGHVELAVTASVAVGSVPAVWVGSLLSSRAPDHLVRPAIGAVIVITGLKYVGVGPAGLVAASVAVLVAGAIALVAWLHRRTAAIERVEAPPVAQSDRTRMTMPVRGLGLK